MAFPKKDAGVAEIKKANIQRIQVEVRGTAPLVLHKFSQKAKLAMMNAMETPKSEKKAKSARETRNYDEDFMSARYFSFEGWDGIPASSFRNALIAACRTSDVTMTKTKMSAFTIADGICKDDGTPLVRIISDEEPVRSEAYVRIASGGTDIRIRPMWHKWGAIVTLEFDADMISLDSIVNLLDRAGRQVGIGEGRPFSPKSNGMGWGTFEVVGSSDSNND